MSSPHGRISASDPRCECRTPCRPLTHDCLSGLLQTPCPGLSLLSTPAVLGGPCWTCLQPLAFILSPDPEANSIHLTLKIHLTRLTIAAVPVLVQATAQSCHDYGVAPSRATVPCGLSSTFRLCQFSTQNIPRSLSESLERLQDSCFI